MMISLSQLGADYLSTLATILSLLTGRFGFGKSGIISWTLQA